MGDLGILVPLAPFLMVVGIVWVRSHAKLEEKRIAATAESSAEKGAQYASRIGEMGPDCRSRLSHQAAEADHSTEADLTRIEVAMWVVKNSRRHHAASKPVAPTSARTAGAEDRMQEEDRVVRAAHAGMLEVPNRCDNVLYVSEV